MPACLSLSASPTRTGSGLGSSTTFLRIGAVSSMLTAINKLMCNDTYLSFYIFIHVYSVDEVWAVICVNFLSTHIILKNTELINYMPSQNINKKLGIPALNHLTSVVLNKIGSHVCWNKIGHFMILSPHFLQQKLLFSYLCWFNVGYLGPEIIIAYIVKSDAWNILSNNVFIQM